jgi:hypothetical protein
MAWPLGCTGGGADSLTLRGALRVHLRVRREKSFPILRGGRVSPFPLRLILRGPPQAGLEGEPKEGAWDEGGPRDEGKVRGGTEK